MCDYECVCVYSIFTKRNVCSLVAVESLCIVSTQFLPMLIFMSTIFFGGISFEWNTSKHQHYYYSNRCQSSRNPMCPSKRRPTIFMHILQNVAKQKYMPLWQSNFCVLCVGFSDFLAMPSLTFAFISEIMILSSIKLYSQSVFGTFFIRNLLASLPLQMVEFQQNSNIFSLISGNLWPTLKHSMLFHLCECVCMCLLNGGALHTVWSMVNRSNEKVGANKQKCPFCRLIYCQNGSSRSIFTANENHLIRFHRRPNELKPNWAYVTIRYMNWNVLLHSLLVLFLLPLHYTVLHNPFVIYEVWSPQWIKSKSFIGKLFGGDDCFSSFMPKYAVCHTYIIAIFTYNWRCENDSELVCVCVHSHSHSHHINRTKDSFHSNKSYSKHENCSFSQTNHCSVATKYTNMAKKKRIRTTKQRHTKENYR